MTPDSNSSLRVRIAEAQGWTFIKKSKSKSSDPYEGTEVGPAWLKSGESWDKWETYQQREIGYVQEPPDYPNDLNGCADFEASLTDQQRFLFAGLLEELCGNSWRKGVSATARQRCEAYLATINPEEGK